MPDIYINISFCAGRRSIFSIFSRQSVRLFSDGLTPTRIHAAAPQRPPSPVTVWSLRPSPPPPGLCECVAHWGWGGGSVVGGGDHRGLIPGLNYLSAPSLRGQANGGQEGLESRAGSSSPLQSHAVDVGRRSQSATTQRVGGWWGGGGRMRSRSFYVAARGGKLLRGSGILQLLHFFVNKRAAAAFLRQHPTSSSCQCSQR